MRVVAKLHGFSPKERSIELASDATAADLLRALEIRRELVLVFRDSRPIPDTEPLHEGDELRVLRVVSGGA